MFFNGDYFGEQTTVDTGTVAALDYFIVDDDDDAASDAAAIAMASARAGFTHFLAASTDSQRKARNTAAERIDAAMPYQGRKYDLAQVREFPRIAREDAGSVWSGLGTARLSGDVWDWDDEENVAVVPSAVKLAELHEAEAILSPTAAEHARVQAAIAAGLASQSVDGVSESYLRDAVEKDGRPRLCPEAARLMTRYRLSSGRML